MGNKKFDVTVALAIYSIFSSAIWGYVFSECKSDILTDIAVADIKNVLTVTQVAFFVKSDHDVIKLIMSVMMALHMVSLFIWYNIASATDWNDYSPAPQSVVMLVVEAVIIYSINIFVSSMVNDLLIQCFFVITMFFYIFSVMINARGYYGENLDNMQIYS